MRLLSAALASLLLAVVGCGGSNDDKSPELPKQQLIGSKQENRSPAGSPQRALMEYWAALQYKAWAQALSFYDPKLRDYVGSGRVVSALSAQTSAYQISAPNPVREVKRGALSTVYYKLTSDPRNLESVSWRRIGGRWRIYYNSALDDTLRANAALNVDGPDKEKPSARAARAGNHAASLQAQFVQREHLPID